MNYHGQILRIVTHGNEEHATLGARDTDILIRVRKLLDEILPDSRKPNFLPSRFRPGKQAGTEGTSQDDN